MTLRFIPKPTPARRYLLNGKRMGLAEAARILDVGLATIARHTHADVIDAAAISALVPCEPFRKVEAAKAVKAPKPARPVPQAPRYEHAGQNLTLAEWAVRTGIPASALRQRIEVSNWPLARALTTPVRVSGRYVRVRNSRVIARIASTFREART